VIPVFAAHLTTAPSPCSFRGRLVPSSAVGAEVAGRAAVEESGRLPCSGRSGDAASVSVIGNHGMEGDASPWPEAAEASGRLPCLDRSGDAPSVSVVGNQSTEGDASPWREVAEAYGRLPCSDGDASSSVSVVGNRGMEGDASAWPDQVGCGQTPAGVAPSRQPLDRLPVVLVRPLH
jgi:hypothetical protein